MESSAQEEELALNKNMNSSSAVTSEKAQYLLW